MRFISPHCSISQAAAAVGLFLGCWVLGARVCAQQHDIVQDGSVDVPAFTLPLSPLVSADSRVKYSGGTTLVLRLTGEIQQDRKEYDEKVFIPGVERLKAIFPVKMARGNMGGVDVDVVMPEKGVSAENLARILINLHGGGFVLGARFQGLEEAIPIASLGGIKVVTVDYRMGPEHKFPAASEDVAAVYREVLKKYKPQNIGIYGCSAGGILTAESIAWFQAHGLPRPGAAGVFGAGGILGATGDSLYMGPAASGEPIPKPPGPTWGAKILDLHFAGADIRDPLVSPAYTPAVLAQFPPTLIITSTRDVSLSNSIYTHTQLIKAGVEAELHVWEGVRHCFLTDCTNDPESREAWDVIVKFFRKHLGN